MKTPHALQEQLASSFDSRWIQGYVRGKLRHDPVYGAVSELLAGSSAPLLDLGCGLGLLPLFIAAGGEAQRSFGVDFDKKKIVMAHAAARRSGVSAHFSIGDVRTPLQFSGNVVLLDVLHYFDGDEQGEILVNAARCTAAGELLIVRECLRDDSWRYRTTQLQERFSRAIGWLRGERLNFPTRQSIESVAGENGLLAEKIVPLWQRTPFNNYLLVFRKREAAQARG